MDSWQETNEAVRDLHKSLLPEDGKAGAEGASIGSSVSEANLLNEAYRLHPDIGTASQLAQPGGFRRAHVLASEPVTGVRMQYAEQPLVTHLEKKGFTDAFITEVVQQLPDGTQIRYESRDYRRGRLPAIIVEGELLAGVERAKPAHFLTWRPFSVSFWESFTILCGACLFLSGSVDWMTPIGDTAHGASEEQSAATVAWPYVCGGVFFLIGCYLALVRLHQPRVSARSSRLRPLSTRCTYMPS
uniref:Uncharacterized protein n=1 Tax=Chrysotila carterae TaxID=13221 RepID=A0A7S4B7D4_CHRCT